MFVLLAAALLQISAVVAFERTQRLAVGIQLQNARDGMIQKNAIVRDNQRPAGCAAQPAFQPLQHLHVQMVGGFIQQQNLRIGEQHLRQRQTGALPPAEIGYRHFLFKMRQSQISQDGGSRTRIGRLHLLQQLVVALGKLPVSWIASQGLRSRSQFLHQRVDIPVCAADHLPDGCSGIRFETLRQVADAQICRAMNAAGGGFFTAGQDAQQSGLSAAVEPDQSHAFAGIQAESNFFEKGLDIERLT